MPMFYLLLIIFYFLVGWFSANLVDQGQGFTATTFLMFLFWPIGIPMWILFRLSQHLREKWNL
jgi:hypothetical protein